MIMEWTNVLAIVGILTLIMALFNFNINKRIDDLKELFKAELKAELAPINEKLGNHITDTDKKIDILSGQINTYYL